MASKPIPVEEKVLRQTKVLEMTMGELQVALDDNSGTLKALLAVRTKGCVVKLVLRCKRPDIPATWAMIVVLNGIPITWIDWHRFEYTDTAGVRRIGWHKHCWSATEKSCKDHRQHLVGFDPVTVAGFLREGFKVLGIELMKGDSDGHGQMPLD
jgi:hypothetical protein